MAWDDTKVADNEILSADWNSMVTDQNSISTAVTPLTDNSMADTLHRHSELSASDGTPDKVLYLDANGTVTIDQNGNGTALNIDSEATTANVVNIANAGTGSAIIITDTSTTAHEVITMNSAMAGDQNIIDLTATGAFIAGAVLKARVNNASATGSGIWVENAGTGKGITITQSGNGTCFNIDNNGTGHCITLDSLNNVEVIDFDKCIDGGTAHTTVAGSIKVQMPNGSTGYINVYT